MWALWIALLVAPADAGRRGRDEAAPEPPERPEVAGAFVADAVQTPGSLWSEVPARRMLGLDNNARQVGDLVTVRILERTTTNLDASTSTARSSEAEYDVSALLGVESGLLAAHPALEGGIRVGGGSSSAFTGSGTTSREAQVESMITCEVLEVLPTGNLRIWGYKQVRVNREVQYVVLDGVVRPRDILLDNTVRSDLLAQARIEVTGGGVVADKQGPGLLVRVLDALWPF